MELAQWLLFFITFSSVLILPGPNTAFAVGQSLKYGFINSLSVPLGFMSASGLHAILVFSSVGLVIQKYSVILFFLKYLGVIYLTFLAYKAFTKKTSKVKISIQEISPFKMYVSALFVSLTNPKALFSSMMLYPLFINQDEPLAQQAVILSLTAMVISLCIYSAYSACASMIKNNLTSNAFANKLTGSLYLGAAGVLASK